MKHLGKLAVLGAVLTASAQFASATSLLYGTVSTGGLAGTSTPYDSFSASGVNFITTNPNASVTGGSGYVYSLGTVGTNATMTSFSNTATNQVILTEDNSAGLTFTLSNIFNYSLTSNNGEFLTVQGYGYFSDLLGDTPEYGTFILQSQSTSCSGPVCNSGDVGFTFTAGASATPEPSSLFLLGTGLLGTAGILMRKRQTA